MKEAVIIVPNADNSGHVVPAAHADLQATLARQFGGFTATQAQGGWQDGARTIVEPVTVYTVAMVDSANGRAGLLKAATRAWQALGQASGYIRYPSGTVDIVDLAKREAA